MIRTPGLFDAGPRRERWRGSTALVVLDPTKCPVCGAGVEQLAWHQPALLRHGGYGATQRTELRSCIGRRCGWTLRVAIDEVRPERTKP